MLRRVNRYLLLVLFLAVVFRFPITPQEKEKEEEGTPKQKERRARAGQVTRTKGGEPQFTADWRDAELKDFLKGIGAIIGKNILIDDSVKGKKITILSQKKVNVSDAYIFLKSVLETQGFGIVEEKDIIKIVKLKDALNRAPIVRMGRELIPEDEAGEQVFITQIVPIYQSNASDLEPLLKRVTSPNTDVMVYKDTNSIVFSGIVSDINKLIQMINKLDRKTEGPGSTSSAGDVHIYTLEYNEAEKLSKVLVKLDVPSVESYLSSAAKGASTTPNKVEKIRAVAHEESNSLIITANKEEWQEIQKIIKILDLPRKQVLLEVLIVELYSSDLNDFGIDWNVRNDAYGQFNSGLASQGGLLDSSGRPTQVNTLSGFSLGFLRAGRPQLIGILNANSTNENFNVLSAPQVLTLDNQKATINVGQDVPVRTQRRNAGLGGDNAVTVDNFEYRPTGIKLEFTPHVNKNNKITLDLDQEVKSIAGLPTQGGNPTFNKRNIKTTITVDNTQTVVIGGLISNDKQKSITKIPLLGDIPLIGTMFRRTTTQLKKTNLMVFLTPHILDTRLKADKFTYKKKKEQDGEAEERDKKTR
jgi:general secretion pathway protein D